MSERAKIGGNGVYINVKHKCLIIEDMDITSSNQVYLSFDDLQELISFYNEVKTKYNQDFLQASWNSNSVIKGE